MLKASDAWAITKKHDKYAEQLRRLKRSFEMKLSVAEVLLGGIVKT